MTQVCDICRWPSWLGQMLPMSPGTGIAADATDSRSGAGDCILGNMRHFQKRLFLFLPLDT